MTGEDSPLIDAEPFIKDLEGPSFRSHLKKDEESAVEDTFAVVATKSGCDLCYGSNGFDVVP